MANETQDLLPEPRPTQEDPLVGSLLGGQYRVEVLIGVGGMGRVYRGTNEKMESRVAIKTLNVELRNDDALARRFEVEAKSAHNLRHPNTIRVYDYGVEDGQLYMVMELLEGESLEDRLRREGRLAHLDAIRVIREACQSLAEAHAQGMVHRDLKPDNLFLNRIGGQNEHVKVLDFGVAKLNDNRFTNATLTQMGMIFGTPRYMSPEQARAQQLDGRSDIYALGVILYELLCGKPPFDGAEPVSVLIKHVNEEAPTFDEIAPGHEIPAELERIVRRCLQKEPEARYASVQELDEVLARTEDALRGRGAVGQHQTRGFDGQEIGGDFAAARSGEPEAPSSRWFGGFGRTLAGSASTAEDAAAPSRSARGLLFAILFAIVVVGFLLLRVLQPSGDGIATTSDSPEAVAAAAEDRVHPDASRVALELLPAPDAPSLRAHPEGDEERIAELPHVFQLDRADTPEVFVILAEGHEPARHPVPRSESASLTLAPGPPLAPSPAEEEPAEASEPSPAAASPRPAEEERSTRTERAPSTRTERAPSTRTEESPTRLRPPRTPAERESSQPAREREREGLQIDIVNPY